MNLSSSLTHQATKKTDYKPWLLDLSKTKDSHALKILISQKKIQHVIDDYQEQLKEYFGITNPALVFSKNFDDSFNNFTAKLSSQNTELTRGIWAYFPWNCSLVHILPPRPFFATRTARNRELITKAEQEKFYKCKVAIAGLSVGNSVALALVLQGGAQYIKLADHDTLALSNTNRIRAGVTDLGLPKVELTARQIYLLNPYAKVQIFPEGLNEKNINAFCENLDIIVDEVDNLAIKFLLRLQAKKRRLPVVMAADNGDNGVVDIERYDLSPKTKFFHGRMGNINYQQLSRLDKFGIGKLITKHVGVENITEPMQKSLQAMGKTIVSWPQLGGAALLNGSAIAYCVRKIANGQPLEKNRAIISLDEKLMPNFSSPSQKAKRKRAATTFKKIFQI